MKHILVIEDDKPTRYQISKLLSLEGYEVSEAEDGIQGIEQANEVHPDLIVCDIMMPNLDGYGTLLRMRENPKTRLIPFIFLTAKSQIEDLRKGMELGADDYLTKPVSPPSLFNSISRRLEKRAHQVEEAERKKQELSLELAISIPAEVEGSIQRIVSLGNIMALKYSKADKQALEICNSLNNEAHSLKRYIRRIDLFGKLPQLYANRFDDGIIDHQSRQASTERAVKTAHTSASRFSRSDDLEIDVPDCPLHLDEQYLEIIVDELVSNAFEASKEGSKVGLEISYDDDMLTISVSDSGSGLEKDRLEQLQSFSKFGQLSQETRRLSLGIPLVHGITRLHGGEFCLEANPEGGLVANVFLPSSHNN